MKKWIFLSLCLSLVFACDKIDDPLKENPNVGGNNGEVVKKVLLEEFTGVRCNNCPAATEKAHSLVSLYGEQLILVSIHASDLAEPDSKHPDDFTTDEGDQLFSDFSLFGVPVGFVDRTGYDDQSIIKLSGQWAPAIEEQLEDPAKLQLSLTEADYNGSTGQLDIQVELEALEDLPAESYMLSIYLLENDIIAPQTLADKSVNENYEHDHLFRTSFHGTYGKEISTTGYMIGDKADFTESIILNNSWVKGNCEVVAFVYRKSNYEILQSEILEL